MAEIFNLQKARAFEHCQEYEHCDADAIIEAACEEIERLQKAISEPVECFGTPELIAWSRELTRLLDVPESERGGWPFVLSVGCHLEKFAKSWHSQTMAEMDAEIERLRADAKRLAEFEDHECQTHEILGAILGTDDSLEECAKRAMKRIQALETALIEERKKYLKLLHPSASAVYYGPAAREQLHSEGLL